MIGIMGKISEKEYELLDKAIELGRQGDYVGMELVKEQTDNVGVRALIQTAIDLKLFQDEEPKRERESYDFIPSCTRTRRSWRDE